ncbi:MAG: enoyl-CoA hydratase [Actinomycetia bacterium]|nr:enoyl-CoA hydratase [Actinomycetes bacterium]MCP5035198.1 enoyl-CoA hydratase [Actinomycetes bacterium]
MTAKRTEQVAVIASDEGRVVRVVLPGGPLDGVTAAELVAVTGQLREDRSIRAIILEAATAPFANGPGPDLNPLALDPDPAAGLASLRPPVIAAVDGLCVSVGFELALAADIRVASPSTEFSFPDLAQGRLPCWGGTQRLSRAVRPAQATAMVLLGTPISAAEACVQGLVYEVVDDPRARALELAAELVARGPLSLELAKEAVHRGAELPLRDGLRLEGDLNHQLAATQDRAEGLQAFFDKRPPDFAGR